MPRPGVRTRLWIPYRRKKRNEHAEQQTRPTPSRIRIRRKPPASRNSTAAVAAVPAVARAIPSRGRLRPRRPSRPRARMLRPQRKTPLPRRAGAGRTVGRTVPRTSARTTAAASPRNPRSPRASAVPRQSNSSVPPARGTPDGRRTNQNRPRREPQARTWACCSSPAARPNRSLPIFEEYIAAHGGVTVPVEGDPVPAETPADAE